MRIAGLINKQKVVINDEKYVLESQIAEGGFAFVYCAKNKATGTQCAIKKILCQTEEQLIETRKEIEVLTRVKHAHIIDLLGYTQQETKEQHVVYFLAMPKYDMSLQDMIDHGESSPHCNISPLESLPAYLNQALSALSAIHQHGYRHNDFKTANLLLRHSTSTPHLVLTDMGSASAAITEITSRQAALALQETAAIHTTASYRSPELCDTPSQCIISPAADIWSYGVVMYNLLFSKTPFEHKEGVSTLAIISCAYTLPSTVEWPSAYTDAIARCLCPMEQRIGTDELLQLLAALPSPEIKTVSSPSPIAIHTAPATEAGPAVPAIEASPSAENNMEEANFANFEEFSAPPIEDVIAGVAGVAIDIPIVDASSGIADTFNDASASGVDILLNEETPQSPTAKSQLLAPDVQNGDDLSTQSSSLVMENTSVCNCTIEAISSCNDEFRDSDFGDFVAASTQATPPKPPQESPTIHHNNSSNSANDTKDVIEDDELCVDTLHDSEQVADLPIVHQGTAYMMRRKKILLASKLVRKQVHMVLTSQQLIVRKSAQYDSKIHLVGRLTRGIRLGKMTGKVGVYIDGIMQSSIPSQWELEFESYRVMEEWIAIIEGLVEKLVE